MTGLNLPEVHQVQVQAQAAHQMHVQVQEFEVRPRAVDGRKSLLEVLQFLTDRGVSRDVICLAMVRAGISLEVARVLSQCVVTSEAQLTAPISTPRPAEADSGRAASLALRSLTRVFVTVVLYLGLGLAFGFLMGMELGLAEGLSQGMEQGLERVVRLVTM